MQNQTQKTLSTDTMSGLTEMEDEEEKQFGSGGMESNPPIELEEVEDKEKQLEKVVAKSNPPQLIVQNNPTKRRCAKSQHKHAPHIKSTLSMRQQISRFSKTLTKKSQSHDSIGYNNGTWHMPGTPPRLSKFNKPKSGIWLRIQMKLLATFLCCCI